MDSDELTKIPETLDEAMEYLVSNSVVKEVDEFRKMEEGKAIGLCHSFLGRQLRNDWKLWYPEISNLGRWFLVKYHIWHADDMSSMVLTSLHRKLNGKLIDAEGQAKEYIKYWKKYNVQEDEYIKYLSKIPQKELIKENNNE